MNGGGGSVFKCTVSDRQHQNFQPEEPVVTGWKFEPGTFQIYVYSVTITRPT
jgi:hypothetical protein